MTVYGLLPQDREALDRLCDDKSREELEAMHDLVWKYYQIEDKKNDLEQKKKYHKGDKVAWEAKGKRMTGIVKSVHDRSLSIHKCSDGRIWSVAYQFARKV